MLVIRLRRTGQVNQATFDVVVAEKTSAVKGKFLELVGAYSPVIKGKPFSFKKDRIEYWISKGAHPSDTMAALLKKAGMSGMEKFMELRNKKKNKKGEQPAAAPVAAPAAKKEEAASEKAAE